MQVEILRSFRFAPQGHRSVVLDPGDAADLPDDIVRGLAAEGFVRAARARARGRAPENEVSPAGAAGPEAEALDPMKAGPGGSAGSGPEPSSSASPRGPASPAPTETAPSDTSSGPGPAAPAAS